MANMTSDIDPPWGVLWGESRAHMTIWRLSVAFLVKNFEPRGVGTSKCLIPPKFRAYSTPFAIPTVWF